MVYRGYWAALKGSGNEKKVPGSGPSSRRGSASSVQSDTDKTTKDAAAKLRGKSGLRNSIDFAVLKDNKSGVGMTSPEAFKSPKLPLGEVPSPNKTKQPKLTQLKEEMFGGGTAGGGGGKVDGSSPKKPKASEAADEERIPVTSAEEDEDECTDLILVIHGIGESTLSFSLV